MRHALSAPLGLLAIAALCSLSLSSAPPARSQEAGDAVQEPAPENGLARAKRLRRESQLAELLGSWQLLTYETEGAVISSNEIAGNAVFSDGFFSLVIHATGYEEGTGEQLDMAQAGIFRFEVGDFSSLQTLTVIGHATPPGIDPSETEFTLIEEPTGGLREYRLQVQKDRIFLQHFTGTRLTFIRMPPAGLSEPEIARLGEELEATPEEGAEAEPAPEQELSVESQLPGAWFLNGYMSQGVPMEEGTITGAAIIDNGTMSLVIHAYDDLVDDIGTPVGVVLLTQAGIYRYRVKDSKMLQTSTIIGHANPNVDVDYEPAGALRQYDASIENGALILRALDGTALRFVRMTAREFTEAERATFNSYGRGLDLIEDE